MKKLLALVFVLVAACATPAPEFRTLADELSDTVVTLQDAQGRVFCSGVAVSSVAILTNKHCTEGGELSTVRTADGRTLDVTVLKQSDLADLSLLRVPEPVLTPARLGKPEDLRKGDFVLAIGHPFGQEWTTTFGYVNKIGVVADFTRGIFIGHTAVINPGNSGGPLFSMAGELVGINTWGYRGAGLGYALALTPTVLGSVL